MRTPAMVPGKLWLMGIDSRHSGFPHSQLEKHIFCAKIQSLDVRFGEDVRGSVSVAPDSTKRKQQTSLLKPRQLRSSSFTRVYHSDTEE